MIPTYTILLVEDETSIRQLLKDTLDSKRYVIQEAMTCEQAHRMLAGGGVHLMLLDWMLPDISGVEFLKVLRKKEETRTLPVIMLTARGEEQDRVRGLDAGADDYVAKPFSVRELDARMQAVLRRFPDNNHHAKMLQEKGIYVDVAAHRVLANGVPLRMGPTEFRLLTFLMEHPDRVFSRSQLLDSVWGNSVVVEERTVDVHIRRLRKSLESQNLDYLIQTVRGMGYRFSYHS